MTTLRSEGFSHVTGAYGGWGENLAGYGDAYHVLGAYVELGGEVADDGGGRIRIRGSFPATGPYRVTVGGRSCSSGVPGRPFDCYTDPARTRLDCYSPPLPPGTCDLVLTWNGGRETVSGAVDVLRRHRASCLYSLRCRLPAGRHLGPRQVEEEPLLIGSEEFP